ncbi:MAG: aminopeptidase [Spirochaetaceae bacterium]|nr:aminopeptidase [Spirochaetaceae bacterium]
MAKKETSKKTRGGSTAAKPPASQAPQQKEAASPEPVAGGMPAGEAALPEALKNAARIAVEESLKIQPRERVLIITNPTQDASRISWALHEALVNAKAETVLAFQPPKTQFDFCSEEIIAALKTEPNVVISISAERMGKDKEAIQNPYRDGEHTYDSVFHHLLYGTKTLRGFWSPRVTAESFIRAVPVDYMRMRLECLRIKEILDEAVSLRVTNKNGTDIVVSVAGRTGFADDGDFSVPGKGGNLPAGEVFVSPVVGSTEGRIVFDGSICAQHGEILIKTPIAVEVAGGFVKKIEGKEEAEELLATILMGEERARVLENEAKLPAGQGEVYARNARNIGELGIGLNPNAKICGNMLEDEKVYRTCHFAIGFNYDEDAPSLIHLDGLVSEPTIVATFSSGKKEDIMRGGDLVGLG